MKGNARVSEQFTGVHTLWMECVECDWGRNTSGWTLLKSLIIFELYAISGLADGAGEC